jgi:hypothetical protein
VWARAVSDRWFSLAARSIRNSGSRNDRGVPSVGEWSAGGVNEVTAGPLGSLRQTVTVGGFTWRVHAGSNGANTVYSFVNAGQTSAGTVNVLAALRWLQTNGWFGGSTATLGSVQFGWEISSTGGVTTNFTVTNYSVSSS